MNRWLQAAAALSLLVASGCATHQYVVKERTLSAREVIEHVRGRNSIIKTLSGSGVITVETRQASSSGSFDVFLRKPDSLRVEFRGPFGIHVGSLEISREQFVFYNRRENSAVVGKPDGMMLQSLFRLKMRFDEIVNAFAGEFPLCDERDSVEQFSVEREQYVLLFKGPNGSREYRVDGDDFLVMGYRTLDEWGNPTLVAFTSRTMQAADLTMPSLLRVVFPVERRSVTIAYDDIHVNTPVNCAVALPKNVEVIER